MGVMTEHALSYPDDVVAWIVGNGCKPLKSEVKTKRLDNGVRWWGFKFLPKQHVPSPFVIEFIVNYELLAYEMFNGYDLEKGTEFNCSLKVEPGGAFFTG